MSTRSSKMITSRPEGAGSLCLRDGWLPAPETDVCPTCGGTAYRAKELDVARATVLSRADLRLALSFGAALPLVFIGQLVLEELYRFPLSRLVGILGALLLGSVIAGIWAKWRVPAVERELARQNGAGLLEIAPMTVGLMAVVTAGFVLSLGHLSTWRLDPAELRAGEHLERLLTATLAHASPDHLLANLLGLLLFGPVLEARVGRVWWAVLVVLVAPASLLAYAASGATAPVVGVSGVVYGLAGAFLVLVPRRLQPLPFSGGKTVAPAWAVFGGQLAAFTMLEAFLPSLHVAWQAHLGGFVAGALLALPLRRVPESPSFLAAEMARSARLSPPRA